MSWIVLNAHGGFRSYHPSWSIHWRRSSIGGCAKYFSRSGMFRSSMRTAYFRPDGGPKTPLRLLSILLSKKSCVWFADVRALKLIHDVERLPRAGVADAEHVFIRQEKLVDDVRVPNRIRGGDDDLREGRVRVRDVLRNRSHPLHPLELVLVEAVLVHRGGALVARGHVLDEVALLRFLTHKRLQPRPPRPRHGRARGPDHAEDPQRQRGFLRRGNLLARQRLLVQVLVPLVLLQERRHDVEHAAHEARVHGDHRLLQVFAHEMQEAVQAGHHLHEDVPKLPEVRLHDLRERLQVRVQKRLEPHGRRLHVNHAAPRHRRRGRNREILHLEHHRHRGRHLDDLAGHEAQLLVVVQHRVHVLDPDRVDRAVEQQPLLVRSRLLGEVAHVTREDAVGPLVRRVVEIAVQLSHRDRLRVQAHELSPLEYLRPSLVEPRHRGAQRTVAHRLPAAGGTHEHEPVPHDGHLVHLDHLTDERGDGLDLQLFAALSQGFVQVVVIHLGLL
eukprot:31278-Pelagococcus_subviridis.AAC.10